MPMGVAFGRAPQRWVDAAGGPSTDPADVVVLGARDPEEAEDIGPLLAGELAALTVLGPAELRGAGAAAAGERAAARLGRFWIHLDVDVLDEVAMPATDYLMPGGLEWDELAALLAPLCAAPGLAGLSLGCLNPEKDPDGRVHAAHVRPAGRRARLSGSPLLRAVEAGPARRRRPTRRRSGGARRARRCRPTGRSAGRRGRRSAPRGRRACADARRRSVTIGTSCGNSRSSSRRIAVAEPGARLERAEQQVGARHADDLGGDAGLVAEHVGGRHRLGHERAHHDDHELGVRLGPEPVAARDRLLARARVERLVDRPRREAEVRRLAARAARAATARAAGTTRGPARTPARRRRSRAARSRSTA